MVKRGSCAKLDTRLSGKFCPAVGVEMYFLGLFLQKTTAELSDIFFADGDNQMHFRVYLGMHNVMHAGAASLSVCRVLCRAWD